MRHILYLFSTLFSLFSCDCNQDIKGTTLDSMTKRPIKNAEVHNKKKIWNKTETDEKGYFELHNVSGGFTCPPMTIIIEHKNYLKVEIEIKSGGQKEVLLQKIIAQQKDTL